MLTPLGSGAEMPRAEISNSEIRAMLYLPDARSGFYRATRFDWSGMIYSLKYQGHEYYSQWFQRVDPQVHDFTFAGPDIVASPCTAAVGPAEEFMNDANLPLGYREAKAGGTFVKIGVGVLRKPDEPKYDHFKTYEIVDPGKWAVKKTPVSVEFTQQVNDASSGYGYSYRKTVRLISGKAEMAIEHSLKNSGAKAIETNVYNHNFLRIDDQGPGPDYRITEPFEIKANHPPDKNLAEIRGNQIVYLKALEGQERVAMPIEGFSASPTDYDVRIENKKAGVGLRITSDRPLQSQALWSIHAVLSVEPFTRISLEPGREFTWSIRYSYYSLSKGCAT